MVELGNSVWVSVEQRAAVQQQLLVLVLLVVQGEHQLHSALHYLMLFSLNSDLVCTLVSHISILSNSSTVLKAILGTSRCHHVELFG